MIPGFYEAIASSFLIAALAALGAFVLGAAVAVVAFLTGAYRVRAFLLLLFVPLIWPPFMTAVGWMVALGESGLTLFQQDSLEGIGLPLLFSPLGVATVQALGLWPIPALFGIWSLSRTDRDLLDQIDLEGGGVLRKSVPMVRIALVPLLEASLLVAVFSISDIATPETLQVSTLPVALYTELNLVRSLGPLLPHLIPLVAFFAVTAAAWVGLRELLSIEGEPLSDTASLRDGSKTGWAWVLPSTLVAAGPGLSLLVEAGSVLADHNMLEFGLIGECVGASVATGLGAVFLTGITLCVAVACPLPTRVRRGSEILAFLLFVVPSPILALFLLKVFSWIGGISYSLLDTFWVLSLGCAIKHFWPCWAILLNGEGRVRESYWEQTRVEGAGGWRTLFPIHIPMLRHYWLLSLFVAWALAIGESSICRILQPPGVQTLAARAVNFMHWGHDGMVASALLAIAFLEVVPILIWVCFRKFRSGFVVLAILPLAFLWTGCNSGESSWGEMGKWRGALFHPRAVEALPSGEWVVLDRTDRVQVFSATGEYRRHWTTPETGRGNPRGLAIDRNGNILVADTHYSQVLRYAPDGQLLQTIGGPETFYLVTDIVEDGTGNLTTLEYGDRVRVQRFDPDGKATATWGNIGEGPGELRRPQGVCLAPNGRIVVADSVNHRIQIFSPEGDLVDVWGGYGKEPGRLSYPYDVATDAEGRVYAIEFGNHRLQVFSPEGESLLVIGAPGREAREFDEPWGITVLDSGEVLVADTRNHRIQNLGVLF